MATRYAPSLAVFASLGLGTAAVQGAHAHSKPSAYVTSGIEMAAPVIYAEFLPRAPSAAIDVLAETGVSLFRVTIIVHGIASDWNETYVVNPEYPSPEMCEAARSELVADFLQILKRRYRQPFNVDSKCVRGDGDV
jgi:hypothetical protein